MFDPKVFKVPYLWEEEFPICGKKKEGKKKKRAN